MSRSRTSSGAAPGWPRPSGASTTARDALAAGEAGADHRYDAALGHWLRVGAAELDHRLDETLSRVGLDPGRRDQPAATLSGGQQARANLACVLLAGFDVLCLDEPTNDLDLAGLELLEDFLVRSPGGYVLVSHDRAFLERVVTGVLELDEHTRQGTRYDGGWQAYQELRAASRRHADEAHAEYVRNRDALRGQAQRTREWSTRGIGKVKRSGETDKFIRHRQKTSSEQLAGKASRAEKALERLERVDKPWEGWDLRLDFADQRRSGDDVVSVRDLVVERGTFRLGPLDLDIGSGERVALLGPNGSGKTTLLRAVLGLEPPDRGVAGLGPAVVVGTLDQHRGRFAGGDSLLDAFVAETGVNRTDARSQLAKLGLGPDHVARPAARLSPGERTRAVLAAFSLVGVNLLVLDEPTNHLDLPAIEQLESALDGYPGTLLLVTHDRRLLDAVHVTRRLELAEGQIVADDAG